MTRSRVRVGDRVGDRDHVRQQREPLVERRAVCDDVARASGPATSFIA